MCISGGLFLSLLFLWTGSPINLHQHCNLSDSIVCPLTGKINLLMHSFFNSSLICLNTVTLWKAVCWLLVISTIMLMFPLTPLLSACLHCLTTTVCTSQCPSLPISKVTPLTWFWPSMTTPSFNTQSPTSFWMCPTTPARCQLHLTSFSYPCTLRQGTSILLDMAFKPDFSTFHSSQLTDSITFCCTSLTNTPQPPGTRSPPGLPHCGLLPWDHAFMRPSENSREKKGSGSHQDKRFINRFSMPLTNLLMVLYISLKFCSIMLKFWPVLFPNNCSALLSTW